MRVDIEELFITLFLGAILLPIAISQFTSVDTSSWSTTLKTVWDNLPVIGLVGVLIGLLYRMRGKR